MSVVKDFKLVASIFVGQMMLLGVLYQSWLLHEFKASVFASSSFEDYLSAVFSEPLLLLIAIGIFVCGFWQLNETDYEAKHLTKNKRLNIVWNFFHKALHTFGNSILVFVVFSIVFGFVWHYYAKDLHTSILASFLCLLILLTLRVIFKTCQSSEYAIAVVLFLCSVCLPVFFARAKAKGVDQSSSVSIELNDGEVIHDVVPLVSHPTYTFFLPVDSKVKMPDEKKRQARVLLTNNIKQIRRSSSKEVSNSKKVNSQINSVHLENNGLGHLLNFNGEWLDQSKATRVTIRKHSEESADPIPLDCFEKTSRSFKAAIPPGLPKLETGYDLSFANKTQLPALTLVFNDGDWHLVHTKNHQIRTRLWPHKENTGQPIEDAKTETLAKDSINSAINALNSTVKTEAAETKERLSGFAETTHNELGVISTGVNEMKSKIETVNQGVATVGENVEKIRVKIDQPAEGIDDTANSDIATELRNVRESIDQLSDMEFKGLIKVQTNGPMKEILGDYHYDRGLKLYTNQSLTQAIYSLNEAIRFHASDVRYYLLRAVVKCRCADETGAFSDLAFASATAVDNPLSENERTEFNSLLTEQDRRWLVKSHWNVTANQ